MRTYTATHGFRVSGAVVVTEVNDQGKPVTRFLRHHVRHSPDGFGWGYGGSGPADLARSLLWDVLGYEPAAWLYMEFKFDVIGKLPQDSGWQLSETEVRAWLTAAELQGTRPLQAEAM